MSKSKIDIIVEDISNHPCCPHGPTILFSRITRGIGARKYFACSACRDKKQCKFFVWEDQRDRFNKSAWAVQISNFVKEVNHRKMFIKLNEITQLNSNKRLFCNTCNLLSKEEQKHESHSVIKGLTDFQLEHPSEMLPALGNNKKEAQYHFSKSTVEIIMKMFKQMRYKNVICIGTPRIYEYIRSNCENLSTILLDIDKRFHSFFGPLDFCWYNMFNNYFFLEEARQVFRTYLQTNSGEGMVLITDPPFGGRTEILSATFKKINQEYQRLNNIETDLPIFWIYPYFMEPQILNTMSDFTMLDFKVEYGNHHSFQNSPKGRKHGSPIRIFTNVKPSLIKLPDEDYKYCDICERWVAKENRHCNFCEACTSKNGETYVHCRKCSRCVKPSWKHCKKCNRCVQLDHTCLTLEFTKECFNCKEKGHKKTNCPLVKVKIQEKRKKVTRETKLKKKVKK